MIAGHDRVVLNTALPGERLEPGDVGTVVHVYEDGKAYEVEFLTLDGHTAAVATVKAFQLKPVNRRDITHVRELQWPDFFERQNNEKAARLETGSLIFLEVVLCSSLR